MKLTTTAKEEIFIDYGVESFDALCDHNQDELNDSVMNGYCIICGQCYGSVEPDARKYPCSECEQLTVYSILEILLNS